MNKICFQLILVFSLTHSGDFLLAQKRIKEAEWGEKVDLKNYIEGRYSLPTRYGLKFIGFHVNEIEPYTFGKDQVLQVKYYAPGSYYYFLKAQEIKIFNQYSLESKPNEIEKGDLFFDTWPVDRYLKKCNVLADNLAILLRVHQEKGEEENSRFVLPVQVYHETIPFPIEYFKAIFRVGKDLKGGYYQVFNYQGGAIGDLNEDYLVEESEFGRHSGGSVMQLKIKEAPLEDYEGWVTVNIVMEMEELAFDQSFRFFFYHRKGTTKNH